MGETEVVSVHKFRRAARREERRLQGLLDSFVEGEFVTTKLESAGLPEWTQGVRVRKAGFFQFLVEATSWRGH